jgi:hypothetical protein
VTGKNKSLFGKFTHDFPDHPKVMPLSDAAFRCLVEATLWSCRQQTDGFLARRYAVAKWSADALAELCANDPTNPSLVESDEGWFIRDFTHYQESRDEIQARRERNKLAGQRGGLAKAKQGANRTATKSVSKSVSESLPDKDKEQDKEQEVTTNVVTSVVADKPQKAKKQRAFRVPDDWMPDRAVIDKMKAERPELDLRMEHDKFMDWVRANDRRYVDWNAGWRNWMRNARSGAARKSTGEQRVEAGLHLIQMYAENNHQGELQA